MCSTLVGRCLLIIYSFATMVVFLTIVQVLLGIAQVAGSFK